MSLSRTNVFLILILAALAYHYYYRRDTSFSVDGAYEDNEIALSSGDDYMGEASALVGAPVRPTVFPSQTQSIHVVSGNVSNSTMDAVGAIKGTGVFNGREIRPRPRHGIAAMTVESVLSASTRPRSVIPREKTISNLQLRPDPVVKEGFDSLPAISSMRNLPTRQAPSHIANL